MNASLYVLDRVQVQNDVATVLLALMSGESEVANEPNEKLGDFNQTKSF